LVKNSPLAVYDFIHDKYNAMDWDVSPEKNKNGFK